MLTETQKKVLTFLYKVFQENNITFQVSGGLAAIFNGSLRPLYDIDLEIHKEDVEKVRTLLREFIIEDWNNELGNQFDIWMMKLEINAVPIDINQVEDVYLISKMGERTLQSSAMDTEQKEFEGLILPVLRMQPLIAYKKKLGREVDLEDVSQLENY